MILGSFIDRLSQFISLLYGRQWAAWEIITIAVVALGLLLWLIRQQRNRKVRRIYENQFRESSPVIGVNLGAHKRGRHLIEDLKRGRLTSIHKHQKPQHVKTKEPSEKLHEEIKQLQYEIIKRKQTEVRLEQHVAQLTADNEKLQRELAESRQAEKQIAEMPAADKLPQQEASQVEQVSGQQVTGEPAVEMPLKRKSLRRGKAYEQRHRIIDGINQKLCRRCKEWKAESEFHKNSLSSDGLAGACKTCKTNAVREYRKRRKAAQG